MRRNPINNSIEALGKFNQIPPPWNRGPNLYKMQISQDAFVYKVVSPNYATYSFLVDGGCGVSIEWYAIQGSPFVKWEQCSQDWTGEDEFDKPIKAKPHWHFDYIKPKEGNWSHLGAEQSGMDRMLEMEQWGMVFPELTLWL